MASLRAEREFLSVWQFWLHMMQFVDGVISKSLNRFDRDAVDLFSPKHVLESV
jgi:hypothetical protein